MKRQRKVSPAGATLPKLRLSKPLPPGPKGDPVLGCLRELSRDRLGFFERMARDYGDVVPFRVGPVSALLLVHPDELEQLYITQHAAMHKPPTMTGMDAFGNGLLMSEGAVWRRQRRLVQPAFHQRRIAEYSSIMASRTERFIAGWQPGQSLEIHGAMLRLSLDIMATTLLGPDADLLADAIRDVLETCAVSGGSAEWTAMVAAVGRRFKRAGSLLERWPAAGKRRFAAALNRLDQLLYGVIAGRRASGGGHGDLLSMLLAARDEGGQALTDVELRDEIMDLVLAGHATTAAVLTWTFSLLAQGPEIDAQVAEELRSTLHGGLPAPAELPQLPLTSAVLNEAMRLFPPVWLIAREVVEPCVIGGYDIQPGRLLIGCPWLTQRDPRWFPDPGRFNPSRWQDGLATRLPKFAYFPFGGGQRLCIGVDFGTVELHIILAAIAQRFRLERADDAPIELRPGLPLDPAHGVSMVLQSR